MTCTSLEARSGASTATVEVRFDQILYHAMADVQSQVFRSQRSVNRITMEQG